MIRYKINVYAMLSERGINTTIAKQTGIFSQSVMQKFKNKDTSITVECLNKLCNVLSLQPADVIEYIPTDLDSEKQQFLMNYVKERIKGGSMRILRIFKLTQDAEKRKIDWSNFENTDIETVEEIEVDDPDGIANLEDIMIDHGYGDFDIYGGEWI